MRTEIKFICILLNRVSTCQDKSVFWVNMAKNQFFQIKMAKNLFFSHNNKMSDFVSSNSQNSSKNSFNKVKLKVQNFPRNMLNNYSIWTVMYILEAVFIFFIVLMICGKDTSIVKLWYIHKSLFCRILESNCYLFKQIIKFFIINS